MSDDCGEHLPEDEWPIFRIGDRVRHSQYSPTRDRRTEGRVGTVVSLLRRKGDGGCVAVRWDGWKSKQGQSLARLFLEKVPLPALVDPE